MTCLPWSRAQAERSFHNSQLCERIIDAFSVVINHHRRSGRCHLNQKIEKLKRQETAVRQAIKRVPIFSSGPQSSIIMRDLQKSMIAVVH